MLITAYFEFASPANAATALAKIEDIRSANSWFGLVVGCGTNNSPWVVEVYFFGLNRERASNPYDFPYSGDVAGIAGAIGASRVTRDNKVIWPRQTT